MTISKPVFRKRMPFIRTWNPSFTISSWCCTEAPCGELGFFIASDGSDTPYRLRVRPPSLYNYGLFPRLVEGGMISDAVAVLSSFHVIAGELDR
jgi:NADH:ubiquinone oxidoreductase subunit D